MRRATVIAIFPLALFLWGFVPFTTVQSVCPTCPQAKADVVVLKNGQKVTCNVLARNDAYHVLEWRGEYRAVANIAVEKVEWKDPAGASRLVTADQVLTKGSVLYHGAIVQEQPGRLFVIQVGNNQHVIWYSQIHSVHKRGTLYPLPQSPAAGEAPAAQ